MLRRKIFTLIPQISQQPHLLSHFVHELISFDISLKDDWNYDGGSGIDGWKGLTWDVLVQKDWFGRWLEVERDCEYFIYDLNFAPVLIKGSRVGQVSDDYKQPGKWRFRLRQR